MKPGRIQIRFDPLEGWVLVTKWNPEIREEEPTNVWTAFEMGDHLEACKLVAELGSIADTCDATPNLDVRGNIVFVTLGESKEGLREEDFDFAEIVDLELGLDQRPNALLERIG